MPRPSYYCELSTVLGIQIRRRSLDLTLTEHSDDAYDKILIIEKQEDFTPWDSPSHFL